MNTILNYVPLDRRHALAQGIELPERMAGAALFADISGFTPATEAIARAFGAHRGAEELLIILNPIYEALIAESDRWGGSVIGFSGDAITVWFDDAIWLEATSDIQASRRGAQRIAHASPAALRAIACALAMQALMAPFQSISVAGRTTLSFALKTTVAAGSVRRLLVGDPETQLVEVLAGALVRRLAEAGAATKSGEVVLDAEASNQLADHVAIAGWRSGNDGRGPYAIVGGLHGSIETQPWPPIPEGMLRDEQARLWLLPPVYARLSSGQGEFLTELRHTISLFLRFSDLDYDQDDGAEHKLDAFIRWVQQVLARHAGWLVQVTIGDKGSYIYATFGAPIAHGDDAARAVGAALELRQPPAELAYAGPVQIGIAGGQSRTGAMGGSTRTYSVMGDATNLAARLMEAAAPGQVLMSAGLAPLVSRRYAIEPLRAIYVKGKSEAVPIVVVSGPQVVSAIQLQEPQYALPLIGRTAEVELLEHKLAQALSRQGQIVGITGEAGMGKSRLVAEAIRRTRQAGFQGLGGAAEATSTQMSYYAWKPIWQGFFGLDPLASADRRAADLERALAALDPALLPRLPLLSAVLDLPLPENELIQSLDAKKRKETLEGLLVDCLRARFGAAHAPPLVLVIEDIHWLDALSSDLLAAIGRAIANLPVLLVVAYRPPEVGRESQFALASLAHSVEIQLGELTRAEAAELIAYKVESSFGSDQVLAEPFIEAIADRAEGNPFYIEELLNYMRDRSIAPGDLAELERLGLPSSLASLLLSRIDQLSAEQQLTLKVASIIGRVFPVALLWGVYPDLGAPEQVLGDLERLSELDITPLDTPEPDLSYLFKHATTQEVAYESLPFALRAQLHGQLGAWLEERAGDAASLDLLAFHYGRSSNLAKQRQYFKRAGDAAVARFANASAIQYYERLLELLAPAEQAPTMLALGRILAGASAWDAAEARYRAVLALAEQFADVHARAQALGGIGNTLWARGRYDEAFEWLEQGRRALEALGDTASLSETLLIMARSHWFQGHADQALALVRESLTLEGADGDKGRIAGAYHLLGSVSLARLEYAEAFGWLHRSLALKRAIGDKLGVATSSVNLAMLAFRQGQLAEAHDLAVESRTMFHELGARWEYGLSHAVLAFALAAQGDPQRAREMQAESIALFRDIGAIPLLDVPLLGLAQAAQLADQSSEAHRYALRLIAAGQKLYDVRKAVRMPLYQAIADDIMARARQQVAQAAIDAAWAEGYTMGWPEAVDYALAPASAHPTLQPAAR